MPSNELDDAIRAALEALGPDRDGPPPIADLGPPQPGDAEPAAVAPRRSSRLEPMVDRPNVEATGVPIWDALGALKSLVELVPAGPDEWTRVDRCVDAMRGAFQRDAFPTATPGRPDDDLVSPLCYPQLELNHTVDRAKRAILGLLGSVGIDANVQSLLARELGRPEPFFEEDDRGTVDGFIEPTGPAKEKQRNDWRLNALASFLDALRRQPYAAVRYAVRLLKSVAIPSDLLSVDLAARTVTFRGTAYPVSVQTCHFVGMLIEADGRIVSTPDVGKKLRELGLGGHSQIRLERLLKQLPEALQASIDNDNKGSWLLVDKLLSYA